MSEELIPSDEQKSYIEIISPKTKYEEITDALINTISERIESGERPAFLRPKDDGTLELIVFGIEVDQSQPQKTFVSSMDRIIKFKPVEKEKIFSSRGLSLSAITINLESVGYTSQSSDLLEKDVSDIDVEKLLGNIEAGSSSQLSAGTVKLTQEQMEEISTLAALKVQEVIDQMTVARLDGIQHRNSKSYSVFLSYSSTDKDEARKIATFLSKKNIKVFLSEKELKPSTKWEHDIKNALRTSILFCLLATPNSLKSEWVATEWGAAWAYEIPILPILLQCSVKDLPERLRDYQAINFHEMPKILDILNQLSIEQ